MKLFFKQQNLILLSFIFFSKIETMNTLTAQVMNVLQKVGQEGCGPQVPPSNGLFTDREIMGQLGKCHGQEDVQIGQSDP